MRRKHACWVLKQLELVLFFLRVDEGFSVSLLFPRWGSCLARGLSRRSVILSILICRDLRHGQILTQRSGQRRPTSGSREGRVVFRLTSLFHQKTRWLSWFPHPRWHGLALELQCLWYDSLLAISHILHLFLPHTSSILHSARQHTWSGILLTV